MQFQSTEAASEKLVSSHVLSKSDKKQQFTAGI
jgi:hypothetical protein